MTFIDLASIGCGRYEGFWTIAQFWPTVRRHTAAAHQKTQILAYGRTEAKTSKSDDNERNHFKWKRKIFLASDFHKEFKSSWYNTPKSKRKYKHHPNGAGLREHSRQGEQVGGGEPRIRKGSHSESWSIGKGSHSESTLKAMGFYCKTTTNRNLSARSGFMSMLDITSQITKRIRCSIQMRLIWFKFT